MKFFIKCDSINSTFSNNNWGLEQFHSPLFFPYMQPFDSDLGFVNFLQKSIQYGKFPSHLIISSLYLIVNTGFRSLNRKVAYKGVIFKSFVWIKIPFKSNILNEVWNPLLKGDSENTLNKPINQSSASQAKKSQICAPRKNHGPYEPFGGWG